MLRFFWMAVTVVTVIGLWICQEAFSAAAPSPRPHRREADRSVSPQPLLVRPITWRYPSLQGVGRSV
jgi:hypothetical protein